MAKTGDVLFDQFWTNYAKIKGKHNSQKEWAKLKQAEKELSVTSALEYVRRCPESQYRKDPERWLKHKCFNDEVDYQGLAKKKTFDTRMGPEPTPDYKEDFDTWAQEVFIATGTRPKKPDEATEEMWKSRGVESMMRLR